MMYLYMHANMYVFRKGKNCVSIRKSLEKGFVRSFTHPQLEQLEEEVRICSKGQTLCLR